jgi:hypothetical protein
VIVDAFIRFSISTLIIEGGHVMQLIYRIFHLVLYENERDSVTDMYCTFCNDNY